MSTTTIPSPGGPGALLPADPQPTEAGQNNQAIAYWQAGEPRKAQRLLEAWLAEHPTALYPWINRQLLALANGETALPAVAMAWQQQMIPAHPNAASDPQVAAFLPHIAGCALLGEEIVTTLVVSADGSQLFIGDRGGNVRIYDLQRSEVLCALKVSPLGVRGAVQTMVHRAPAQELVVCHQSGIVRIWDLATRLPRHTLEGPGCWAELAALAEEQQSGGQTAGDALHAARRLPNVIEVGIGARSMSHSCALSQDGQRALFGWSAKTASLWDVQSGRLLRTLGGHTGPVTAVALSADGHLALTADLGRSALLWDTRSGAVLHRLESSSSELTAVALSPDGRRAATALRDRSVRLWDTTTGQPCGLLSGHSEVVNTIVFAQDGKQLVTGSADRSLRVWDGQSGSCVRELRGHGDSVVTVALHPMTNLPMSGSNDKTLYLWKTPANLGPPLVHNAPPSDLRRQRDDLLQRLQHQDLSAHAELRALTAEHPEYQQDSELLTALHRAGSRAGVLTGVHALFRTSLFEASAEVRAVATAPGDSQGALTDARGNVFLFDLELGKITGKLPIEQPLAVALAFSPDGHYLLTGGVDKVARLWARPISEQTAAFPHGYPVCAVGFSADSKLLITATKDESVARIWDVQTGELRYTVGPLQSAVKTVALSPDATLLLVENQQGLAIWEVATGKPLRALIENRWYAFAAGFSADGRWVLGATTNRALEWYDTASGVAVIKERISDSRCVALSPDGRLVALSTADKKLKLLDAATGKQQQEIEVSTDSPSQLFFSGDSQYLLATSGNRVQCFRIQGQWEFLAELLSEAEPVLGTSAWPSLRLWPHLQKLAPLDVHLEVWRVLMQAATRSDLTPELGVRLEALRAELPVILLRDVLQHGSPFGRTASPPKEGRRRLAHPVYRTRLVDPALATALEQALAQKLSGRGPRFNIAAPTLPEGIAPTVRTALPSFHELFTQLQTQGGSALQSVLSAAAEHAASPDGESTWGEFLCRNASIIQTGGADALLQRALAEQPDSPVVADAQHLIEGGSFGNSWLESLRPLGPKLGAAGHRTLRQFAEGIRAQAHPDGRTALVTLGKEILIIQLGSGLTTTTLQGHSNSVVALAVAPDGRTAASVAYDGELRLWELATGRCLYARADSCKGLRQLLITPDNQLLVGGEAGVLQVWELTTGELVRNLVGHTSSITWLALHPDGQLLLSGGYDRTLRVWDLQSGALAQTVTGELAGTDPLVLFADGVRALAVDSNSFRCWDLSVPDVLRRYRWEGEDRLRAPWLLHPDQRRLITAHGDNSIGVWDLESGQCEKRLPGHTKTLTALSVLPDGRHLITASDDGTLRTWDLEAPAQAAASSSHQQTINVLATGPGQVISAAEDATLRVWDPDTGQSQRELKLLDSEHAQLTSARMQNTGPRQIVLHPSGRLAITRSAYSTILVWDLQTGKCIRAITGHTQKVTALVLHPDGWRLISGSEDGTIKLWNLESGACLASLSEQSDGVTGLAPVLSDDRLVAGYYDGTIRIWDLTEQKVIMRLRGHSSAVTTLWFDAPQRTLISADDNRNILQWDLTSGRALSASVASFAVSLALPGGVHVITASYDGEIQVLRTKDGQLQQKLKGHTKPPRAFALHPRRPLLLSAAEDRTARLWELTSGQCLAVWYGEAPIVTCAFYGDDRIALGDASGQVVVLRYHVVAPAQSAELAEVTLRCASPEQAAELHAAATAAAADDPAWQTLRSALVTHREGVLWVSQKPGASSPALLAKAATRTTNAPFGPELHIYCRFTLGSYASYRQQWLQLAAEALRDWPGIAPPAPVPTWDAPKELPLVAQLTHDVRAALGRILIGRVVFLIDGLDMAVTQDPWFIAELIHGLNDHRVLWVCAGQPIAELGAALAQVTPIMVFPWETAEVAWPETPNGGPPQPLSADQRERMIHQASSFDYYMSRLRSGVTWPWLELQLRRVLGVANDAAALAPWLEFFRRHTLALSRGDATTLLQLAIAEGNESPIAQAAEAWLTTAQWTTPWLRRIHIPAPGLGEPRSVVLGNHQTWIRGLALAPDGRRLASYADDSRVRVWDLDRLELGTELLTPDPQAVLFGATPEQLVCVQRRLGEWNLTTGACVRRSQPLMSMTIATHPQVSWLAEIDWNKIKIWDLGKQEPTRIIEGLPGRTENAVVHPDGRRLITASDDRIVRVWDVGAGTCVLTSAAFASAIRGLALHPDGRRLFVMSERGLGVWDLETGSTLASYAAEFSYRTYACFSSTGHELFITDARTVRRYDAESGKLQGEVTLGNEIRALVAHPDGVRLITGHHDGTLWVTYLPAEQPPRRGHRGGAALLAIDDHTQLVVTGSPDRLLRWELLTDTLHDELPWPSSGPRIHTLAAAHGLGLVLGTENTIELWDLATGTLRRRLTGHTKAVRVMELNRSGEHLMSLGEDALRLWELASGTCIKSWEDLPDAVRNTSQIALLPDEHQLWLGVEPLQLWDADSSSFVATLAERNSLAGMALDAAGQRLVIWSPRGTVRLWDVATRQLLTTWKPLVPPRLCALTVTGTVITIDMSGVLTYLKLEAAGA